MSVTITDNVTDEGQACFEINTPSATYLYQKAAGGFSSLLAPDGNDWLNFHPDRQPSYPASGANAYRGLPNLVHGGGDDGVGHPGFEKCQTRQVDEVTVESVSLSGRWRYRWTFADDHARLDVLKTPDYPYWFLYEGTPAGRYAPAEQAWATDEGVRRGKPDFVRGSEAFGRWQWLAVGDESSPYTLLIVHLSAQGEPGTFSYLGDTEMGVKSPDGMVVLGFGRGEGNSKHLKGRQSSIVSLYEGALETALKAASKIVAKRAQEHAG